MKKQTTKIQKQENFYLKKASKTKIKVFVKKTKKRSFKFQITRLIIRIFYKCIRINKKIMLKHSVHKNVKLKNQKNKKYYKNLSKKEKYNYRKKKKK